MIKHKFNRNIIIFMLSIVILFLFIFFGFSITSAEKYKGGEIVENEIWTESNNPYIVFENITIKDDISLTINPGVVVKFEKYTGITSKGKLFSNGDSSKNVTFTSNLETPNENDWMGISGDVAIIYSTIEFARIGLNGGLIGNSTIQKCGIGAQNADIFYSELINNLNDGLVIDDFSNIYYCTISKNINNGIRVNHGGANIKYSNITNNGNYGISVTAAWGLTRGSDNYKSIINSCNIFNNQGNGIYLDESYPDITLCNISNNGGYGVFIDDSDGANIFSCIISNNSGGIYADECSPKITNCTIYENQGNGIYSHEACPILTNCTISKNQMNGIYSSAKITSCIISENFHDGINITDGSSTITDCKISKNKKCGISIWYGYAKIMMNIIKENDKTGIFVDKDYSSAFIKYCTIENNNNSGVKNEDFYYCNIFNNTPYNAVNCDKVTFN